MYDDGPCALEHWSIRGEIVHVDHEWQPDRVVDEVDQVGGRDEAGTPDIRDDTSEDVRPALQVLGRPLVRIRERRVPVELTMTPRRAGHDVTAD
jgi:hypothetical protein